MADQNANPSQDPANDGSMGGMLREVLAKWLQAEVDDMLPCTVLAVDSVRGFVQVRPQIKTLATDGTLSSKAKVAKVPIFTLGAGNFVITFPVKVGDPGWIKASDRDISLYIQANAEAGPNTNRLHSFSDGVFFPDKARAYTLASGEDASVVIQSLDGSSFVAVGADHIKIKNATVLTVDCPDANFTGNITADGTITGKTDVVFDGISGKGHLHSGVQTGGGNTGKPVT